MVLSVIFFTKEEYFFGRKLNRSEVSPQVMRFNKKSDIKAEEPFLNMSHFIFFRLLLESYRPQLFFAPGRIKHRPVSAHLKECSEEREREEDVHQNTFSPPPASETGPRVPVPFQPHASTAHLFMEEES